jgi:DNA-binding transcriptional LysR family regulator
MLFLLAMRRIDEMTLVQLQVLIAIADSGGFTAAAARLGMSQSAVSHSLTTLEQELGVTLVERGRRGVRLSEVGERVLAHARAMGSLEEHIRQEAAASLGVAAGKLRIGSFPSISARLLPGILRRYTSRYPGVEVVLFEGTDDEVRDWIGQRVVDIGVVTEASSGIAATPLFDDELVAVCAADDPLVRVAPMTAATLAREPFILSQAGCEPLIRAIFARDGATLTPAYAVRDVPTILAMVREGLGVTIVPRLNLPVPPQGLAVQSLTPPMFRSLAFGTVADRPAPPMVRAFLDEAQAWVEAQGRSLALDAAYVDA